MIHAVRALRSAVHGFATIEATGGFDARVDTDASFAGWSARSRTGSRGGLVDAGDARLARGVRLLHLLPRGPPELQAVEALARLGDLVRCDLPQSSSGASAVSSASPVSDSSYSTRAGTRA